MRLAAEVAQETTPETKVFGEISPEAKRAVACLMSGDGEELQALMCDVIRCEVRIQILKFSQAMTKCCRMALGLPEKT